MKWMIASDLHGSAFYTARLLERMEAEQPDRVLLLGDLLYHGPRNDLPKDYAPKQVLAMLNARKDRLFCVRGNCEAEVDQMVLEFPVLADYALLAEEGRMIFATHGHHHNENQKPPLQPGDVLLYGHTHVPICHWSEGVLCLNPGSVSIPKEGSAHGYLMLEEGVFSWKDLDGTCYHRYDWRHQKGETFTAKPKQL